MSQAARKRKRKKEKIKTIEEETEKEKKRKTNSKRKRKRKRKRKEKRKKKNKKKNKNKNSIFFTGTKFFFNLIYLQKCMYFLSTSNLQLDLDWPTSGVDIQLNIRQIIRTKYRFFFSLGVSAKPYG